MSTPGLLWLVSLLNVSQDKVIISHYFILTLMLKKYIIDNYLLWRKAKIVNLFNHFPLKSQWVVLHTRLFDRILILKTQKLFVIFLLERRSLRPTEEQKQSANSPKEGSPGFKKSFWFSYSSLQRGTVFSPHNSWVISLQRRLHTQSVWRGGQS